MAHKQRGYIRDTPQNLLRDYKLFAIACEGGKREPAYFNLFQYMSNRIKVDVIDERTTHADFNIKAENRSAPKWVLDRAVRYVEKEGLLEEDELWFVMDIDRWSDEQIREIATYCEQKSNWNIVLSNPCFEVWLYFHMKSNISLSKSSNCAEFKHEVSTLEKGGYHPFKFIPYIVEAINNSKQADSNKEHYMPNFKESKVYQLGEALLLAIGQTSFIEFLEHRLPHMINNELKVSKTISPRK